MCVPADVDEIWSDRGRWLKKKRKEKKIKRERKEKRNEKNTIQWTCLFYFFDRLFQHD